MITSSKVLSRQHIVLPNGLGPSCFIVWAKLPSFSANIALSEGEDGSNLSLSLLTPIASNKGFNAAILFLALKLSLM